MKASPSWLHQGSSIVPVISGEKFRLPEGALPREKPINLLIAVRLSNNRKSISALQKGATAAGKKRKAAALAGEGSAGQEGFSGDLDHQEAEAIAIQDELDEQFANDVEAAVERERMRAGEVATPTPAPKRAKGNGKGKSVSFERHLNAPKMVARSGK
ncbi:hypothetical protein BDZ45DRAFT_740336 [Acephala macrosclerotiorum]|nr:hypothetical protein BDZ45DRAFT_740336 [Acephala macrosclerotiorum]